MEHAKPEGTEIQYEEEKNMLKYLGVYFSVNSIAHSIALFHSTGKEVNELLEILTYNFSLI